MSEEVLEVRRNGKPRHRMISLILLGIVTIIIGVLWRGLGINQSQIPSAQINKPAHDFSVKFVQGQQWLNNTPNDHFKLTDFRGKPLILNFWASWCASCRDEARDIERFWKAHPEVAVVGIAIQDTLENAQQFAQAYGKTYILGLDEDGMAGINYGVTGVPETFVIDRNGTIVHREAGPVNVAMLEKLIKLVP